MDIFFFKNSLLLNIGVEKFRILTRKSLKVSSDPSPFYTLQGDLPIILTPQVTSLFFNNTVFKNDFKIFQG